MFHINKLKLECAVRFSLDKMLTVSNDTHACISHCASICFAASVDFTEATTADNSMNTEVVHR